MTRLIAALVVVAGVTLSAAKEYMAERFEVTAAVQADGSLEVVERIVFHFTGGDFTEVFRTLPSRETDGVQVIEAQMDGRVLPRGTDVNQVEVDEGRSRTRVTWTFAPVRDGMHVFSLRYRLAGVVRHGEGEDWFQWRPFPDEFKYTIASGEARLTWPSALQPRRLPGVEGAAASTWPVPDGFALTVANYRERDDNVRLTVRFEPGVFLTQEPQWQRDERRADRLAPAFIAAALMIAAATALALWLFFLRYKRDPAERPAPASVTAPPDDLPPALAGAIAGGRVSVGGPQLLATAFDLARRGLLTIEERPGGGLLKKRDFIFRRTGQGTLRPHERAVLDAMFEEGTHEAPLRKSLQRVAGRAGKIGKAVSAELEQAGFIDRDRKEGRRAMSISGVVVIIFAGALLFGALATALPMGPAMMLVPLAFAMSGLTMVIVGAGFSTLSRAGLVSARRWDAFGDHIKGEAKRGRVPHDGEAIGRMLPYAAALGALARFGKALEKSGVRDVPQWLRSLDAAGANAAMVAVIAASTSSTSHGGGAGGSTGGGAGGGASGAS